VIAITLYFLFRDDNSHKAIGKLPSDNNYSSDSSNTTPSTHPIIDLHNLPGSIVTASSYQDNLVPEKGRMSSNDEGFWQPDYGDTDPWIQFTFPDRYEFSSIQIQYSLKYLYKLNTVDILFASDDNQSWKEPIRIHGPSSNLIAELNHTFNPTVKSKIIRIKIISVTNLNGIGRVYGVPLRVGLNGRLVKD
jgi:hypothetical protein